MSPIDVAMARSLHRRSMLDVLAAAVYPVISRRDTISDVKTAFSSWDNCMAVTYCKWPVIAVIIIGGLIIISIIWCIARCVCCGLSCCCECCYCLKCCGDCCGCCTPRRRNHKYLDESFAPPNQGYQPQPQPQVQPQIQPQIPYQNFQPQQQYGVQNTGYRAEEPMMTGAAPISRSPAKDVPQFATFEVTKSEPADEDALPAMPSWESANHTKVLMEEESVELTDLKKPVPAGQSVSPVGGLRSSPGVVSPGPVDNVNPYGAYGRPMAANNMGGSHPAAANGYMAAGAIPRSTGPGDQAYGQNNQGYNQSNPEYGQGIPGYGQGNPGYSQGGQGNLGYGQNNLSNRGYNTDISRQYSASDYGDSGFDQQTMASRHQTPVQSPLGYGGPSPGPQQAYARNMQGNAQGNMGAMGNMSGNGGYDSFGRNASPSPGPLGYNNLDRRTPRIPDVGLGPVTPVSPVVAGGMEPSELYGGPSSRSPPNGRPLDSRPPPVRTYTPATSSDIYGGAMNSSQTEAYEMPGSPLGQSNTAQSNSGFDFGSGYSRPEAQTQDTYNNARSNGYNTNVSNDENYGYTNTASPPPLMQPQPRQAAYPGYRPYQQ